MHLNGWHHVWNFIKHALTDTSHKQIWLLNTTIYQIYNKQSNGIWSRQRRSTTKCIFIAAQSNYSSTFRLSTEHTHKTMKSNVSQNSLHMCEEWLLLNSSYYVSESNCNYRHWSRSKVISCMCKQLLSNSVNKILQHMNCANLLNIYLMGN